MSRFFIRRPIVAIVIAIVFVVGGAVMVLRLPVAQFPEIAPPQIETTAMYTGADALTVEQSVATPIDAQVNGVKRMIYMQATRERRDDDAQVPLRPVRTSTRPGGSEPPRAGPGEPADGREQLRPHDDQTAGVPLLLFDQLTEQDAPELPLELRRHQHQGRARARAGIGQVKISARRTTPCASGSIRHDREHGADRVGRRERDPGAERRTPRGRSAASRRRPVGSSPTVRARGQ
jgi:hypothetical protein